MLYIPIGDGGRRRPWGGGKTEHLLSGVPRINPTQNLRAVLDPGGQPFAGVPGITEIWMYGLQAWQFSFAA
jgi:hypothetical protein